MYVLNLTLNEFKRSVLADLIYFYNDLVDFYKTNKKVIEKKETNYFKDFLLEYKRDYGINAKSRFKNYIIILYDIIIEHIYDLKTKTTFKIVFHFLKNQILSYKSIFFNDIKIIEDFIRCPHNLMKPIFKGEKFEHFKFSCVDCEIEKINDVFREYYGDIFTIVNSSIKNKLTKILRKLYNLKDKYKIDGRKHYCINLTDLFLILMVPPEYTIFTSNYTHFKEICILLNKSTIYLIN